MGEPAASAVGGQPFAWCRTSDGLRRRLACFAIVNGQFADTDVVFSAINGGNDLFGRFMTPAEVQDVRDSLANRLDWPYLPTNEPKDHVFYSQTPTVRNPCTTEPLSSSP